MFTGIIREIGLLKRKKSRNGGVIFEIYCKKLHPRLGQSIAVNGVCLTVSKKIRKGFSVDIVPATLQGTNLSLLKEKAKLNLEPSLKVSERFDGHFVLGHVDGIAQVLKKGKISSGTGLILQCPTKLMRFISEKGSLSVNGVSVTVAQVQGRKVIVALIPFTEKNTNLGEVKRDDRVNIEVDIIARYVIGK